MKKPIAEVDEPCEIFALPCQNSFLKDRPPIPQFPKKDIGPR